MTLVVSALAAFVLIQGAPASATTQSCEFPTYQYKFVANDGTYRDLPGGNVKGYLIHGDLLNSGFHPSNTGWIEGNFYTAHGTYLGSGWALRQYFHFVRLWC
ncbi:hypothetical protein [Lentzea terrae]|uniref:hypothetical protein n=1 Tax=Lentzea terrae TaxID=2200761 RepID=UPI000DD4436F|nr:hypothetical protein [Lentzea terrae]